MESMKISEQGIAIAKDNMSYQKGITMWTKGKEYPYKIDDCTLMISTEQGYWSYWKWSFKLILEQTSFDFMQQS